MITSTAFTSRSLLSVPATMPARFAKAAASGADEIVIDLEDAVAPQLKAEAREQLALGLADLGATDGLVVTVRVNPLGTAWFLDDVVAVAAASRVDRVMLPKVESAADLVALDAVLRSAEASCGRTSPLGVLALVETAVGLDRVSEIAVASARTAAVVPGYADLSASLSRRPREQGFAHGWTAVQSAVAAAARAAGVGSVDGPWLGVEDDEEFQGACALASALGFDATWVIHPRQVATANGSHTPTEEETEQARAIVEALAEAQDQGLGAVVLDGQMLDEAVAKRAVAVLARSRRRG